MKTSALALRPLTIARFKRYQAYEAQFDPEVLQEARDWFHGFDYSRLPAGSTTFARSSGPGGQHVNKTETKAMTVFPVKELLGTLPKALHSGIRASKYYTASNDSLTFHAQTHRSRTANAEDNRRKLVEEVTRIYRDCIPSATSVEKRKKHQDIEKRFHESRIKQKKFHSSKKQSRRGSPD
ncbi:hypothetical protein HIM_03681 [Hirsutella minnesotensis 3608]|uniref:Prokaryotic-type class I peptide chain release factors domain-containing protein n=1 Tax=Hirsutella minnesotensis 3608 TaxID=1043627 RepID=A0A0F8A6B8_9HYPO|nr:hypothetical protein HIM_03681 [Hirsutella minnesotensis 3608]